MTRNVISPQELEALLCNIPSKSEDRAFKIVSLDPSNSLLAEDRTYKMDFRRKWMNRSGYITSVNTNITAEFNSLSHSILGKLFAYYLLSDTVFYRKFTIT